MPKPSDQRFEVIAGGDEPKPYHRRGQGQQYVCRKCEAEFGTATSTVLKVRIAPRIDAKGFLKDGSYHWACAHCLARGKLTLVT